MSVLSYCSHCDASDCNRRKGNKIRCTRFSQWVDPNNIACEEFNGALSFLDMSPEKIEEIASLYRDFTTSNNK